MAKEKDIALKIALKLGKYIEDNIPDVKVVYTRTTDVFVELWKRAEIANEAEADLFISIHVNAHPRTSARGTLTLVLGQHRAGENFDVAVRENSVILLEDNYETIYEGFDPKSAESYIMFSLMQKTYFRQSIEFGSFVQDQFRERALRKDLGVREQGLQVLAQTSMPGVLIETGFISNPEEEKFLVSDYGQDIIASAIFRGFRDYKAEIERRSNFDSLVREEDIGETAAQGSGQPGDGNHDESMSPEETAKPELPHNQVVFRIQVACTRNKIAPEPSSFKGYENVIVVEDGRWYKYMVGMETVYEEALDRCLQVKQDFPDAFVVALKNGKPIPMHDAILEINQ
jgi:N-acetylmuramoyl-L-alanine amidase